MKRFHTALRAGPVLSVAIVGVCGAGRHGEADEAARAEIDRALARLQHMLV